MSYQYRVQTLSEHWLVYPGRWTYARDARRFALEDRDGVLRHHADLVARGIQPTVTWVQRTLSPASRTPKRFETGVHLSRVGPGFQVLPGNWGDPYEAPAAREHGSVA